MAHVVVVDDVAVVSTAISIMLTRAGHTVETAASGREALSIVVRRAPDAVITDLWMPDLDGLGLIRALQADFPDVAIVAMSGGSRRYSGKSSLDHALESGVRELLMKPFGTADLLKSIANALDGRSIAKAMQNV